MHKETITYKDYNGLERKEDFYFNLTHAELTEMELGVVGGFTELVQKIIDTQDGPQLVKTFKEIVLKSYGEKSADGKRFVKSDEIATAFAQTEAYSQLFMALATDADRAAKFVNGIVPSDVSKGVAAQAAQTLPTTN